MRWNCLILLAVLVVNCTAKEEDDTNEVSVTPPSINLNVNFRKALLKALIELENEDNNDNPDEDSEKIVEKASASALSVFTNSEGVSTTSTSAKPITKKTAESPVSSILVQRSQAVQQSPITTFEKEELDPFNDAEQILTSASSSFTLPDTNSLRSDGESRSINKIVPNIVKYDKLTTTEFNKIESTTTTPTSSTEESEAKAEEVQFFSAPLVVAFTVHQDEQGVPKKVESILRPEQKKQQEENILQRESKLTKPEKIQVDSQLEFQQKQKLLEQEILRLNLNLKQQQLQNQRQQELFLRQQQEQLRLRNNAQPFLPIANPTFKQFNGEVNTEKPIVNQFIQFGQSLPTKPAQPFNADTTNNNSGVTLVSSVAYNPIIEAGKLPLNAQVLPVRGPINFHTPIIQTAGFQQFHSIPQATSLVNTLNQLPISHPQIFVTEQEKRVPLVNTFHQLPINQPQFIVTDQGKRTFRQEVGTGNYLNNDPNRISQSFSIQKSVQPTNSQPINPNFTQYFNTFSLAQPQQVNRIFRSSLEGTLTAPPQQVQSNRFFRSNLGPPSNFNHPQNNNYQLSNLLYNSGALGNKVPEDINIISKVLALNHSGGNQYLSSNSYGRK
ncbi:putative uncharacterized protein DDB_G0291608 [Anoplophora glabripennis]|uniref:putative uncharacterized protein DDB_G0291608 n=1 Tax=Anoplophora glabripennis TaxID=217634 RepID=UPI000874C39B|nr:putative uncharacterized protein DDB_G0291608 [Anoplophora glabripennis]